MKMKVTNYELSRELDKLGFNCGSHTGWWVVVMYPMVYSFEWLEELPIDLKEELIGEYHKAYDCWDLIKWLKNNCSHDVFDLLYAVDDEFYTYYSIDDVQDTVGDKEPQNALAKAILTILKGRK